ncbi:MAG: hypothetical protein PHT07_10005 [Paludibacter sp.]|nr:hypothetical protein [Paludibacter sp.]
MKKTQSLIILIGNGTGRHQEAIRSLCAEMEYEEISLFGTPQCEFPTAIKTNERDFLDDFGGMIDPLRIGQEYYGVSKEAIVEGHSDRKVISVPVKMAESIYSFAINNSVAPIVINFEQEGKNPLMSDQWCEENSKEIGNLSIPIALNIFPSDKVSAKNLHTAASWASNYLSKKIDFTELREKSLGTGRANDLLKTISEDVERKMTVQKMSSLALAVGMSVAGSPEIAIATLGAFYYSRDAINDFNEKNSLFKHQGFSLAERLNFFVFGHDDSENNRADIYTEKEKSLLFYFIDKVDKVFGKLNDTSKKMEDVKDLYISVKTDYFQKTEKQEHSDAARSPSPRGIR